MERCNGEELAIENSNLLSIEGSSKQSENPAKSQSIEEGSSSKRLEHNAKERVRRMKLNASYLALHALLPNSRRSKKRWSNPFIIDKVLQYLPALEKEIGMLKSKKDALLSSVEKKQQPLNLNNNLPLESQVPKPTVSITQVKDGEVIIQICMQKGRRDFLSKLIENVQREGMNIEFASSNIVCDDRVCCNLKIQVLPLIGPVGADYAKDLKDK
ncbi:Myc-type, basic helix-loop-helix (bHLH) domain, partial [Dillenia turbinata]